MRAASDATYESVALSVLVYEFPFSRKQEAEDKIKARLKRRALGAFEAVRIEALRKLKDDLQREIGRQEKSPYYVRSRSQGDPTGYADMNDFDLPRLTEDLVARHPDVPAKEIEWFVPFATFIYHLL
jgi:hypothetical protein